MVLAAAGLACNAKHADDADRTADAPHALDSDDDSTDTDQGSTTGTGVTREDTGDSGSSPVDHVIRTSNDTDVFVPADLVIAAGETIRFEMTSRHNAVQVSEAVYTERRVERLEGGFVVGFGQTEDILFPEPGVFYYICEPHVLMDMVGTITVQ